MAGRFFYYLKIWLLMSKNSFLVVLSQKKLFSFFLVGKLLRFSFFFAFLYFLVIGAKDLAGYTVTQTIFFFLTFNAIDISSQFLFREVYRFRQLVVTGDFDLVLIKPVSALFRSLMGGADFTDLLTLPPLFFAIYYIGSQLSPSSFQVILYLSLLLNGVILAAAFHIAVLALGIITLEIDHTIMIYRDLTSLGRLPIDIYKEPLKGLLTYFLPLGIMITLPAKALMGLVTPFGVILSFGLGFIAFLISLRLWSYALRQYTSASS